MFNLYQLDKNEFLKIKLYQNYDFTILENFHNKKFIDFSLQLILNFRIIAFIKILFFILLNRYAKLAYVKSEKKIVAFCFFQKKIKKYFFMNDNDIMLGNIYCKKNFRNYQYSFHLCHFILSSNLSLFSSFFYLCREDNVASNKLATKCYFKKIIRLDKSLNKIKI